MCSKDKKINELENSFVKRSFIPKHIILIQISINT